MLFDRGTSSAAAVAPPPTVPAKLDQGSKIGAQSPQPPQREPDGIAIVPPEARNDAYQFALAVVNGMSGYIGAEELLSGPQPSSVSDFVNWLAALRTAQAEWNRAGSLLNPFTASRDTLVATWAGSLAVPYRQMSVLYGRKIALVENAIRSHTVNSDELIIESSKLQSRTDEILNAMAVAFGGVTGSLCDLSR
jgi:hypothetical protein